jgi:hypothetical protein
LRLQHIKHMAPKNLQLWETKGTVGFIKIGGSACELRQVIEKVTNTLSIEPFGVNRQ